MSELEASPSPVATSPVARVPLARVPLWGAIAGVIVGGVAGQTAGLVALLIAIAISVAAGGRAFSLGPELLTDFAVLAPSVATTGLVLALTAVGTVRLARAPIRESLGLRRAPWLTYVAGALGMLAVGPTSDLFLRLMQLYLPWMSMGALEGIDRIATSAPVPLVVLVLAVVPGICEELLFRGLLQRAIGHPALAVLVSAVAFACFHVDPHHVVAVLPAGFYLAFLGARTGTVTVPMVAHVTNNAAAVLARALLPEEAIHHAIDWTDLAAVGGGWVALSLFMALVHLSVARAERATESRIPQVA